MLGGFLEKQTSFSWSVKTDPWALHAVLLSLFRLHPWRDPKAFIPAGNQPEIFLCQFSPTPQFRQSFSPTNPTMKDLSSLFVHLWHLFFDCSLSCRQHAAYANTRSFIRAFPPLNECNLKWGHTFCGGGCETCAWNSRGVLHALICCRSSADMSPCYSGLQPILTDGGREDQRRPALATELLGNMIKTLQRRTCENLHFFPVQMQIWGISQNVWRDGNFYPPDREAKRTRKLKT